MVFNIFKRKPKVNTNTAYAEKIRTAHDRLENKSSRRGERIKMAYETRITQVRNKKGYGKINRLFYPKVKDAEHRTFNSYARARNFRDKEYEKSGKFQIIRQEYDKFIVENK